MNEECFRNGLGRTTVKVISGVRLRQNPDWSHHSSMYIEFRRYVRCTPTLIHALISIYIWYYGLYWSQKSSCRRTIAIPNHWRWFNWDERRAKNTHYNARGQNKEHEMRREMLCATCDGAKTSAASAMPTAQNMATKSIVAKFLAKHSRDPFRRRLSLTVQPLGSDYSNNRIGLLSLAS